MLKKDYTKLYQLQDKFLSFWETIKTPFYLTGGTALGRYYLQHRYSEDLDFFVNGDSDYKKYINTIYRALCSVFTFDVENNLFYDDFTRLFLLDNDTILKLDFVNDIPYRTDNPKSIFFGKIDTPINILSNKLSALINREEPKDIFDIIHLSLNYQFNWAKIFVEVKQKAMINEIDVEQKINSFPVALFSNVDWFIQKPDYATFSQYIKQISDDFITGSDNSVCTTNIHIEDATVNLTK